MNILTTPLTPTYFIVLFNAYSLHAEYHISKMGYVLYGSDAIETSFSNKKMMFYNHSVMKISAITEDKAKKIFIEAGIDGVKVPYINYSNRDVPANTALESLESFIDENWPEKWELTWIIIPKPNKELKGKKMPIEFSVGAMDFRFGDSKMELDVFMTAITKTSKSIKFSVAIPKFLYDKCMTDPVIENRPGKNYLESEALSSLHNQMQQLVNQAHNLEMNEVAAQNAKKVICIYFNSKEETVRDAYNHGYTGQRISTQFNFFIAYKVGGNDTGTRKYFTYKKYQTGMGSTERGIKGIIDTELTGGRNYLMNVPSVIINWTQEREDFLIQLEERFRSLSDNLNNFLAGLDEEKLQKLIENSQLLKLGN